MEYYDVIIIGAGIAGCGLAYNLKRIGYKGSVLVIDNKTKDKESIMHRNTFEQIIKEYDLEYVKKYKGIKICSFEEEILTINESTYFIDYDKICKKLLKRSNAKLKNEEAIGIKNKKIRASKGIYGFRFLIDCSGSNPFLRKQFNFPLPFRYWIGYVSVAKGCPPINKDYCYYSVNPEGILEDFYPLDNLSMKGVWKYVNKVDFSLLKKLKNESKMIPKISPFKEQRAVIPCSPVFPLVYKNLAFLGSSFGNATPSAGEGIQPTLDSSKILSKAIKIDNLKYYNKEWKNTYLEDYIRHLAFKTDFKERLKILKLLKQNQDIVYGILRNKRITLPKSIRKQIPMNVIIKQILYLLNFKFKYLLQAKRFWS